MMPISAISFPEMARVGLDVAISKVVRISFGH